ncbi:MAG: hypothetical protein QOD07_2868 [Frankiaceae bacterium]|jgi:cytochrome P450|nr:hypothetical protein [Frankiaceae bacterium]
MSITDSLSHRLTSPTLLRPVFAVLRRFAPVLVFGHQAVVSRDVDVVDVLSRPDEFTVSQINAANIDRHDGPFILGMDPSEQYTREHRLLRDAVRVDDLDRVAALTAQHAAALVGEAVGDGRIDVVNGYARVVALRLVTTYFGVPLPSGGEPELMGWLRDIFFDVFLNFTGDRGKRAAAMRSGIALKQHLDEEIARREALGAPGERDDVLGRLLAMKGPDRPWLDDDTVRRNLSGLVVGAVETTSKFVALAMTELLRRPDALAGAREAALRGDTDAVRRYAYEAERFFPHTPFVLRYCANGAVLGARRRRIRPGSHVLLSTISAMFDPTAFPGPGTFDADRKPPPEYLHFGYGMHRCFGAQINDRQVPELVAGLVRLPGLRVAPGRAGRIRWDGPFPDRLVVAFDDAG